jgi:hypothetical protein
VLGNRIGLIINNSSLESLRSQMNTFVDDSSTNNNYKQLLQEEIAEEQINLRINLVKILCNNSIPQDMKES